jgi:hypothetical protein
MNKILIAKGFSMIKCVYAAIDFMGTIHDSPNY